MRVLQIQSFDEVPDDFGPINSTGDED